MRERLIYLIFLLTYYHDDSQRFAANNTIYKFYKEKLFQVYYFHAFKAQ